MLGELIHTDNINKGTFTIFNAINVNGTYVWGRYPTITTKIIGDSIILETNQRILSPSNFIINNLFITMKLEFDFYVR